VYAHRYSYIQTEEEEEEDGKEAGERGYERYKKERERNSREQDKMCPTDSFLCVFFRRLYRYLKATHVSTSRPTASPP